MESNKFWNLLTQYMEFPFDTEEVKSIDANAGTIWVELNNGEVYYLTVQQCEPQDTPVY